MTIADFMRCASQLSPSDSVLRSRQRTAFRVVFCSILLLSAALRVFMFMSGRLPFDMDQAVPGIGALRILREGRFCIVWPGQSYAADIFPLYYAPLHLLFPPSVALLRLGMIPVTLLLGLATCFGVARTFGSRTAGLVSMALILFAPSMVFDKLGSPAFLSTVPLAILGIAMPLFFGLWKTVDRQGWTARSVAGALGLGVLLGLAYWVYPLTVIYAAAMIATLVIFPRSAMRFCGFVESVSPDASSSRHRRLRAFFQTLFLSSLGLATWVLIAGPAKTTGNVTSAHPEYLVLVATTVFTCARLWVSLPVGHRPHWEQLGAAAGLAGYWIGASPIVYMNWVCGEQVFMGSEPVSSTADFFRQLASVFHTGLPVLLGWYHNWAQPVRGVPVVFRLVAVASACAGLIWLLFCALTALRRRLPSAPPLVFLVILFAMQTIAFSASSAGRIVEEPRYLVTLYWIACISVGLLVRTICGSSSLARVGGAALVCVVAMSNAWTCLDVTPKNIVRWTGEEKPLGALVEALQSNDLTRVSCRLSRYSFFYPCMISYISDERVIAAPADLNEGRDIRSARYQREVDHAPQLAYLLMDAELSYVEDFLRSLGVDYEMMQSDNFRILYNVEPDILRDLTREDIPGLVENTR